MLKNIDDFNLPEVEEKVLEFWKKNNIFNKSLVNRKGGEVFNFFEGPPTANGHPGIHHVLTRSFKDIVLRYKTMQGYLVPRKAGWDTHGLPVEIGVEKQLGLKSKKEIEKYGIAEFNKKCRESVWDYKEEWEHMTERMGFWLDMNNPYVTYETPYIESLWNIFSVAWAKKLLYKGHKIIPWCTRCGTGLSSHEIAQGYKETTDTSLYIKFKLKKSQSIGAKLKTGDNTYVLSWTTTAWTLPGNVALAVGEKIKYVVIEAKVGKNKERWIVAKDIYEKPDSMFKDYGELVTNKTGKPIEISGKQLVGKKYEQLWNIKALSNTKSHKIYPADFVTTTDGTGVVHTAVMYGDDDYQLGVKLGLPQHHTVDEVGKFTRDVPKFSGLYVKATETEKKIIAYLTKENYLLKTVPYTHEYPFCWRCSTPLLYYARDSWFIEMSKLRKKLIASNKNVNWIPEHIKKGRFGAWIKEAKDWAISRDRYWGAPLPIWQCDKGHIKVVESLEDLKENIKVSNNFYILRHGEAEHNIKNIIASGNETNSHTSEMTELGVSQAKEAAEGLKKEKITHIFTSPYLRAKATAKIVARATKAKVYEDKRLQEINTGIFNWKTAGEYHSFFDEEVDAFTTAPSGGETLNEVKERMFNFVKDINSKYEGANILIVSHGDPLWMLEAFTHGYSDEDALKMKHPKVNHPYLGTGEWRDIPFKNVSYNDKGETDLHRPYIDSVELNCSECKNDMKRVEALADVWFDSGAMPFASTHYPFENKELLDNGIGYPADFIVEGMDQTRGWFYTLLAVSTILGKGAPYKNVMSLGLVNDKFGQKMSKSKGNTIAPMEMIDKHGVDVIRWFFYTVNPPGESKNFDEVELNKISRRFFGILYNSFVFYNSSLHKSEKVLRPHVRHILDMWILSRLNETIIKTSKLMDDYEIGQAARTIESLVDDLSRWYIRRSRGREEAVRVLGFILLQISKMMAPFAPFFADSLYKSLTVHDEQSVHLEDWPEPEKEFINPELEKGMAEVRRLATSALSIRAQEGVKVRQPLAALRIKENKLNLDQELFDVLAEEINVKEIVVDPKIDGEIELDMNITPELKQEGMIREISRSVQSLRQKASLKPGQKIDIYFNGPEDLVKWLKDYDHEFMFNLNAATLHLKETEKYDAFEEIKLDGRSVWIGIKAL